jgi:exo-beta-1,3-glucanase (GH17 family)
VTHSWKPFLIVMLLLIVISHGRADGREGGVSRFPALFSGSRYIAYTPRSFSVVKGVVTPATPSGIESDLKTLRFCFDGLVTYSALNGLEKIPEIAKQTGFRAIILGIWDPASPVELQHVLASIEKYPEIVAAVIVGNEGLYSKRYQTVAVETAIKKIKAVYPELPVATSEPFFLYLEPAYFHFFNIADFLAPNVHPVFEPWFKPENPEQGVSMVIQVVEKMKAAYGKPVLVKETGMPSGPESRGFTKERQARFWKAFIEGAPTSAGRDYVCFEAFDAPWKPAVMAETFPGDHVAEGFWGFFSADGSQKPVVKMIPWPLSERSADKERGKE